MLETYRKLYSLLSKRDRYIMLLLVIATILMALVQVAGISSIAPFLALVAKPDIIETNKHLNWVYTKLSFDSHNNFLVFLGLLSFIIITLGNVFNLLTNWMSLRFIHMRNYQIAIRLVKSYLYRPYIYFLNKNSSEMGKNILTETSLIVNGLMQPTIEIFSKGTISFFIIVLMVAANPTLALFLVVFIGGSYLLFYNQMRKKIVILGKERRIRNSEQFKAISETFGAIKDIKLYHSEDTFTKTFQRAAHKIQKTQVKYKLYSVIPNYAIGSIAFGGLLIIVLYLLLTGGQLEQTLPLIGLYGYSIMRLKPSLQTVYSEIAKFRYHEAALDDIYEEITYKKPDYINDKKGKADTVIPCKSQIKLYDIYFQYPGAKVPLFQGLTLEIPAYTMAAFVGETGSGKTTLVDIILGLLRPQKGSLIVDEQLVDDYNIKRWQQNLGYVPQNIYISDDTITSNIALGSKKIDIDMDKVVQAAKMAQMHEFIINELPEQYDTVVGERGIRMSGGQRQRLAIARALYREPEVLILDEATSALDSITEENVFEAIREIAKTKTVIVIAHRLSTIRDCDNIFMLDKGKIIASGTYDYLLATSPKFQNYAKIKKENIAELALDEKM